MVVSCMQRVLSSPPSFSSAIARRESNSHVPAQPSPRSSSARSIGVGSKRGRSPRFGAGSRNPRSRGGALATSASGIAGSGGDDGTVTIGVNRDGGRIVRRRLMHAHSEMVAGVDDAADVDSVPRLLPPKKRWQAGQRSLASASCGANGSQPMCADADSDNDSAGADADADGEGDERCMDGGADGNGGASGGTGENSLANSMSNAADAQPRRPPHASAGSQPGPARIWRTGVADPADAVVDRAAPGAAAPARVRGSGGAGRVAAATAGSGCSAERGCDSGAGRRSVRFAAATKAHDGVQPVAAAFDRLAWDLIGGRLSYCGASLPLPDAGPVWDAFMSYCSGAEKHGTAGCALSNDKHRICRGGSGSGGAGGGDAGDAGDAWGWHWSPSPSVSGGPGVRSAASVGKLDSSPVSLPMPTAHVVGAASASRGRSLVPRRLSTNLGLSLGLGLDFEDAAAASPALGGGLSIRAPGTPRQQKQGVVGSPVLLQLVDAVGTHAAATSAAAGPAIGERRKAVMLTLHADGLHHQASPANALMHKLAKAGQEPHQALRHEASAWPLSAAELATVFGRLSSILQAVPVLASFSQDAGMLVQLLRGLEVHRYNLGSQGEGGGASWSPQALPPSAFAVGAASSGSGAGVLSASPAHDAPAAKDLPLVRHMCHARRPYAAGAAHQDAADRRHDDDALACDDDHHDDHDGNEALAAPISYLPGDMCIVMSALAAREQQKQQVQQQARPHRAAAGEGPDALYASVSAAGSTDSWMSTSESDSGSGAFDSLESATATATGMGSGAGEGAGVRRALAPPPGLPQPRQEPLTIRVRVAGAHDRMGQQEDGASAHAAETLTHPAAAATAITAAEAAGFPIAAAATANGGCLGQPGPRVLAFRSMHADADADADVDGNEGGDDDKDEDADEATDSSDACSSDGAVEAHQLALARLRLASGSRSGSGETPTAAASDAAPPSAIGGPADVREREQAVALASIQLTARGSSAATGTGGRMQLAWRLPSVAAPAAPAAAAAVTAATAFKPQAAPDACGFDSAIAAMLAGASEQELQGGAAAARGPAPPASMSLLLSRLLNEERYGGGDRLRVRGMLALAEGLEYRLKLAVARRAARELAAAARSLTEVLGIRMAQLTEGAPAGASTDADASAGAGASADADGGAGKQVQPQPQPHGDAYVRAAAAAALTDIRRAAAAAFAATRSPAAAAASPAVPAPAAAGSAAASAVSPCSLASNAGKELCFLDEAFASGGLAALVEALAAFAADGEAEAGAGDAHAVAGAGAGAGTDEGRRAIAAAPSPSPSETAPLRPCLRRSVAGGSSGKAGLRSYAAVAAAGLDSDGAPSAERSAAGDCMLRDSDSDEDAAAAALPDAAEAAGGDVLAALLQSRSSGAGAATACHAAEDISVSWPLVFGRGAKGAEALAHSEYHERVLDVLAADAAAEAAAANFRNKRAAVAVPILAGGGGTSAKLAPTHLLLVRQLVLLLRHAVRAYPPPPLRFSA